MQPHRWQPIGLCRPWDSPSKNTGVGCHFLLQCMKVKSESEVAQSCPTLSDPMDCSLPGSSVHEIFPGKSPGVGCHCLLHIYAYIHINLDTCRHISLCLHFLHFLYPSPLFLFKTLITTCNYFINSSFIINTETIQSPKFYKPYFTII